MPKKSANARTGTQRNKPKAQKSFELVRPETGISEKLDTTDEAAVMPTSTAVSTSEKHITPKKQVSSLEPEKRITQKKQAMSLMLEEPEKTKKQVTSIESEEQESSETPMPKGSAAARMAARRRAAQKAQQRNAASLITAEHFAYVRKDLVTIAILACIMFTAIIVLYFMIGKA
jgi:hypothetical protein